VKSIVWFVLAVLAAIGAGVVIIAGLSGTPGSSRTATLLGGPVPTESATVTYADLRAMLLTPAGSHQEPTPNPLTQPSSGMCGLANSTLGTYDGAASVWSPKSAGGALEMVVAVPPSGAAALFRELVAETTSPACTASAGSTQPGVIQVRTIELSLPQVGDQSTVVSVQLGREPLYFLVARFDSVIVKFVFSTAEPSHQAEISFLALMGQVATKINAELAYLAKYGNPRTPPIPSPTRSLQVFIAAQAPVSASTRVGNLLHASAGIASCSYLDHLQSWHLVKRLLASDPIVVNSLTPAETPPVFMCKLRPGANESMLLSQFSKVPGVFQVSGAVQPAAPAGL
jgi:hypothetical protein